MNINKYLRSEIDEKMKKIEELSLSQDINKKNLTEILKKLNITIKTNEEILYSGDKLIIKMKIIKIKKID